jgi:hypothetical protein
MHRDLHAVTLGFDPQRHRDRDDGVLGGGTFRATLDAIAAG